MISTVLTSLRNPEGSSWELDAYSPGLTALGRRPAKHRVPRHRETRPAENQRPWCLSPTASLPPVAVVSECPCLSSLGAPGIPFTDLFLSLSSEPKPHPWVLGFPNIRELVFGSSQQKAHAVPGFSWEVAPRPQMPWDPDFLRQVPFQFADACVPEQLRWEPPRSPAWRGIFGSGLIHVPVRSEKPCRAATRDNA